MKKRDNRLFLNHMLEAIETISKYLSEIDEAGFTIQGSTKMPSLGKFKS
jgi:uncharacterized protein with HEPN domain